MNKLPWLLGITAIVVLLLIILGPALLDLHRLNNFVETSSKAYEADGGPWPHLTDECIGCHGVRGHSLHEWYPSLAGQPAPYLAAQLHNFSTGERAGPNMGPLSMTMSGPEVQLLANYFARQPAGENRSFRPDPTLRDKGRQLVQTLGCAACHGDRLEGHDPYPRLAGQGYDYLVRQLSTFADGTRSDPTGTMKNLAVTLSVEDRKAIASYLASYLSSHVAAKN